MNSTSFAFFYQKLVAQTGKIWQNNFILTTKDKTIQVMK